MAGNPANTGLSFRRGPNVDEDGLPSNTVPEGGWAFHRNLRNASSLVERTPGDGWKSDRYLSYPRLPFEKIPGFDEDGLPSNTA
jgi:hypothetical protein